MRNEKTSLTASRTFSSLRKLVLRKIFSSLGSLSLLMKSEGSANLKRYMLCFISPTINRFEPEDMRVRISSCSRLLSWYSSIKIYLNNSLYCSATRVSETHFKAYCWISAISIAPRVIFFSFSIASYRKSTDFKASAT